MIKLLLLSCLALTACAGLHTKSVLSGVEVLTSQKSKYSKCFVSFSELRRKNKLYELVPIFETSYVDTLKNEFLKSRICENTVFTDLDYTLIGEQSSLATIKNKLDEQSTNSNTIKIVFLSKFPHGRYNSDYLMSMNYKYSILYIPHIFTFGIFPFYEYRDNNYFFYINDHVKSSLIEVNNGYGYWQSILLNLAPDSLTNKSDYQNAVNLNAKESLINAINISF